MAMGKRRPRPKQTWMWVATQDLPRSAAHPFYTRLNQILDEADFDRYVESLCQRFDADEIGRPGLPPGRYFRMLLPGYFEGLDSERALPHGLLSLVRLLQTPSNTVWTLWQSSCCSVTYSR